MKTAIAMLALLAFTFTPTSAHAQQPVCKVGSFRQFDLAGTYVSAESQMRLEVYPCGGSWLVWSNQFGQHQAIYYSTARLPGGGVAAPGIAPDPTIGRYLDNTNTIGIKPGVPGTVEVITMTQYGEILGWYTLRKIT